MWQWYNNRELKVKIAPIFSLRIFKKITKSDETRVSVLTLPQ